MYQDDDVQSLATVVASLSAMVWKIKVTPGDWIQTKDDVIVILEAMKTEIPVMAGEEHVGKQVKTLGSKVREGSTVKAGDILVTLA